jgi:hypothetical protein
VSKHLGVRQALLLTAGGLALAAPHVTASGQPPQPVSAAMVAQVARVPLPAVAGQLPSWTPAPVPEQMIDDFEASPWPDPDIWPAIFDLSGRTDSQLSWGPRDCRAASGSRALWAIGGGADGGALPCDANYPDGQASSAVLALDLRPMRSVSELWLQFDIWADAPPNEGLFVNVLEGGAGGNPIARHVVYSATGRSTAWARRVRLDLTRLEDRQQAWAMDARGNHVLLELLFVSLSGLPDGQGIFLDNLSLVSREPTPIVVTPTPAPDITMGCSGGTDCGSLTVHAFVDSGCDGRYQAGIDRQVTSGPRVDVTASGVLLGTELSPSGSAYFRLPYSGGALVRFAVPDGYEMCANSPNPVELKASAFKPFGRAKLDLRVRVMH